MKELRAELQEVVFMGERIFHKILENRSDAVFFLQVDDDMHKWLRGLEMYCHKSSRQVYLITFSDISLSFCSIIPITKAESEILLKYYSLYRFYDEFYILSFDKPYSTHALNLLDVKDTELDDLVNCDVFRLDRM